MDHFLGAQAKFDFKPNYIIQIKKTPLGLQFFIFWSCFVDWFNLRLKLPI